MIKIHIPALCLAGILFLCTMACRKSTEIIIPVHQASLAIIKDFKDFKKCVSSDGDTFVARYISDTIFLAGEAVNNQIPIYQVIRNILYIEAIDVEITFEITADYHAQHLTRKHDRVLMKIISHDRFNEMTITNLPKEWVCLNNCEYQEQFQLLGEVYKSVLLMRHPKYPNIFYTLDNSGKFIGFSCSNEKLYKWID